MFDPWVVKIPGEGKGYPLQYSGLENSMDCIVHGVAKSQTRLSDFHFPQSTYTVGYTLHCKRWQGQMSLRKPGLESINPTFY